MRLLVYVEPTSYVMGLWRELQARSSEPLRLVFLHENVSQAWNIDLSGEGPQVTVLVGSTVSKLIALWRLLLGADVRLIHLAGWGGIFMLTALLVTRVRGLPVTVETDTFAPPHQPLWKRLLKKALFPVLFAMPSMFLPAGSRQAAYLRSYGVANERITVAQMTVDVRGIAGYVNAASPASRSGFRTALGLPADVTVFLYVGRLELYKGVHELLVAFQRLTEQGVNATLVLVGDGSMQPAVRRAAQTNERIIPVGRKSGLALLDAYAAADVFVLPSRLEMWGLVVNEAMAAGLPVIATDRVGCVDDLVQHGATGLVVHSESDEALAAAMATMAQDRLLRERMADNARSLIAGWTLADEADILIAAWQQTGSR